MPQAEQIRAAISPGSTPYGERGALEDAIGGAASTSSAASPEAMAAPAMGMAPINPNDPFGSPMSAIMGEGGFSSDRPITSGLTVGPGSGPAPDLSGLPLSLMQKLQDVALNAKSPQLRGAALLALRRIVRNRGR